MKKQIKKKNTVLKESKTKKTVKKQTKASSNIHAVLRRKRILCHTCKFEQSCYDALHKTYPYICMVYEARVD